MKARLNYGWRLVATGMSFVVFGVCGLLFSLLVFPLAWLWPHRASRQRVVTTIIHWFFRALVAFLQWVGVMELEVSGAAALRDAGPVVVVANHPTYLDVVVLLALTPSACCVVKNAHWGNPCFWGIVRAAEYVSNADPVALVEAGARQLAAGYTLIIFPEGTRTAVDAPPNYKTGVAQVYVDCGVACLPVALNSGLFWPRRTFMRYPGTLVVEFLDPLPPGLTRKQFITEISTVIEAATNRLVKAAREEQAQLFGTVPSAPARE